MSVVVAIFDDSASLDRAIERLSDEGFDDTVLDPGSLSQGAFLKHLRGFHLPAAAIDSYGTNFAHGAKFVLVRTDKGRAEEALEIFQRFDAAQTHRHD